MPTNRVVLLTGAAGGLGRVMTRALLQDGHGIAAIDRDASGLERLAAAAGGAAERLCGIVADLSTDKGCAQAIEAAATRFGRIDALINNAGIGMSAIRPDAEARYPGIEELTPEIWDSFFAIFVRAPVRLTRAVLPMMRKNGFGRLVNNTTSYRTMLRVLPYGAAKAALESMSAVWARNWKAAASPSTFWCRAGPPIRRSSPISRAGRARKCCGRR
jgi:NAD(P)-dependent dehydrogenase (short-subunit alcohol dehydrogenase family)